MRRTKDAVEFQWVLFEFLGIFIGMKILAGVHEKGNNIKSSVVTLGNFDGIHRGHQKLLTEVRDQAESRGWESVVFTFAPHPLTVLSPQLGHKSLYPRADLKSLLEPWNIHFLVLEPFSAELSQVSARDFFNSYLLRPLSPKMIIVGENFCFGSNREGTTELLKTFCDENKILLKVVPPVLYGGYSVSSSLIRQRVRLGDVRSADQLLGHPYTVSGKVIQGAQRGRGIGFPTANLDLFSEISPAPGVYVSGSWVRGKWHASVTNIGCNPTFAGQNSNSSPTKFETHILNFNEKIYGEEIRIEFYEKIRNEISFSSVDNLKAQIFADSQTAKTYFEGPEL